MFGSRLAVQHSALNNTERLLQADDPKWRCRYRDRHPQRYLFTAAKHWLIILDEEQEHTYQSESAPRYSAHDVAKKRAMMEHSLLLFSSATPLHRKPITPP